MSPTAKGDRECTAPPQASNCSALLVFGVRDLSTSPQHALGEFVDVFTRREDAERFIEEVRGDAPELAKDLRIEERELAAGRPN
jgi:hypothetical protein